MTFQDSPSTNSLRCPFRFSQFPVKYHRAELAHRRHRQQLFKLRSTLDGPCSAHMTQPHVLSQLSGHGSFVNQQRHVNHQAQYLNTCDNAKQSCIETQAATSPGSDDTAKISRTTKHDDGYRLLAHSRRPPPPPSPAQLIQLYPSSPQAASLLAPPDGTQQSAIYSEKSIKSSAGSTFLGEGGAGSLAGRSKVSSSSWRGGIWLCTAKSI